MTERKGLLPPPPRLPRRTKLAKRDAGATIDAQQAAALVAAFEALSARARDGFVALCESYGGLDDGARADLALFAAALRAGLPKAFREKLVQAVRLQHERKGKPRG